MHPLLEELHVYHHNISITIDQLEKLLFKVKNDTFDKIDRKALFKLQSSLHSEAEKHHHQNEELIRQQLITTKAPIHQRVKDIQRDHESFDRMATRLRELEHSALTPKEIAAFIDDYIHKYYDHLDGEENIFFPMADKWLTDDHWQEIHKHWKT